MADDFGATTATTGAVTVGGSATGTIEVGADRDWFRITLVAGQSYIFNLDRGTLLDPFLVLYDQNGVDIVGNDDIVTNVNFNSQIRFTATVSGTYYLAAFSSDGTDIGTYTVRAAIDPSPPVSTDDYGAQAGSPNVGNLAVGGSTTGNLETPGDRDWFAVTLVAGTSYTFRQNGGTLADPKLFLRDGNGVLITGNDDDPAGGLNSVFNYTAVSTGVYYLEANTADQGVAGTGTYTVLASVNGNPPPAPTDDFGSQVGASNLGSVTVGSSSTGLINYGGDHDWFSVTLSAGSIYRIRQEIGTLPDPRFTLRNSIGVALTGDDDSGGGQNAQVDFTATTSGIYYIDANSADGTGPNSTGNYTVRVTLLYGAPVIVTNTGSAGAEGATDIVTSSELSTTDADTAASAIVYTLTTLATNGTLTRSGSAIALNGTFTQADINSNLIAFNHNGSETTSASFGFSVTDGTTNFTGRTFNFTVTPVNDAPTSTGLQGDSVTTTEPAGTGSVMPNVKIDSGGNAAIADADNANFNGGSIRFAITAGLVAAQDQLVIDTAAATTVTVAGNVVSVGGTAIGTVSGGGAGGAALVVTFNNLGNATAARVQTLIRAIDFANTGGDNPTAGARTITTTLNDGSGGAGTLAITSTVTVAAANDAPVATGDANTVLENGTITNASVFGNDSDPDGPALSVGAVNGVAGNVGTQITLASGALVTLRADGTYDYNPNGAFNYLIDAATAAATAASNISATDSFSYTLTGGGTATVTVTVNGVAGAGDELRGTPGVDFINGTAGNDTIVLLDGDDRARGFGGNDTIFGGLGYDQIGGGDGDDILDGGTGFFNELGGGPGNDTFVVRSPGDSIVEFLNEGTDVVQSYVNVFVLPANVENLSFLGTGNFVGVGNGLDNLIFGGIGADSLAGGGGNDTLVGGGGAANELQGGAGDDIYVVSVAGDSIVETVGGGIDTVVTALGAYVLPTNVENLAYTGSGTFSGLGNALDNVFSHTGGNAAELSGLGGNDTYVVTVAGDTIVEAAAGGTDTVRTTLTNFTLANNVENLTYTGTGIFNGVGNSGDNVITGGALADAISGMGGNDTLIGGNGADVLIGGTGADIFRYLGGETGLDRILDFNNGVDKISLNAAFYSVTGTLTFESGASPFATTANSTFLYDSNTGIISYDADGNGAGAAVQIAQLDAGLPLSLGDLVIV
jgi:Cadherin-like/Bacterial cadherin-like domain/Bacterial pre-peptidase C-terminal domain/RTX calcium-binding nonapeptide repeat (4 copies)